MSTPETHHTSDSGDRVADSETYFTFTRLSPCACPGWGNGILWACGAQDAGSIPAPGLFSGVVRQFRTHADGHDGCPRHGSDPNTTSGRLLYHVESSLA